MLQATHKAQKIVFLEGHTRDLSIRISKKRVLLK